MRDAAGDRQVEVTLMGPAVVGKDDAAFRSRLEAMAANRDTTADELEANLVERGLLVGTPERVAETVSALEEVGVSRLYIQWLDLDNLDGMKETVTVVRG